MLKKYLAKFAVDILPSVAATVIGAYIVNHYIVSKPGPGAPAVSVVSTVDPQPAREAPRVDTRTDAKTAEKSSDTPAESLNNRGPGVKARGISERAILEKSVPERAQERRGQPEKSGENIVGKPAETASIPAETRRHPAEPREKTAARTVPAPMLSAPGQPAPAQAAPAEVAGTPAERRDANELARAAIDRLRGSNEVSPRPQEAARIPDSPRVVVAPAARPLPPPIMVSTPVRETVGSPAGYQEMKPPHDAAARNDGPGRPTPPADILSPPLDLRAETSEPLGRTGGSGPLARARTTAEDVWSVARSMFHVVLPR